MEFLNKIIWRGIVGNVTINDINGQRYIAFSVVTEEVYKSKDANLIETTWMSVSAFEKKGIADFDTIKKGVSVEVIGRIKCKTYVDSNGKNQRTFEIVANEVKVVPTDSDKQTIQKPLEAAEAEYEMSLKRVRNEAIKEIAKLIASTGTDTLHFGSALKEKRTVRAWDYNFNRKSTYTLTSVQNKSEEGKEPRLEFHGITREGVKQSFSHQEIESLGLELVFLARAIRDAFVSPDVDIVEENVLRLRRRV